MNTLFLIPLVFIVSIYGLVLLSFNMYHNLYNPHDPYCSSSPVNQLSFDIVSVSSSSSGLQEPIILPEEYLRQGKEDFLSAFLLQNTAEINRVQKQESNETVPDIPRNCREVRDLGLRSCYSLYRQIPNWSDLLNSKHLKQPLCCFLALYLLVENPV